MSLNLFQNKKNRVDNFNNWNNDGTIADMYSPDFALPHYFIHQNHWADRIESYVLRIIVFLWKLYSSG